MVVNDICFIYSLCEKLQSHDILQVDQHATAIDQLVDELETPLFHDKCGFLDIF